MHTCTYTHVHTYMYTHIQYMCICTHMYAHAYIHIHMYKIIHTGIHDNILTYLCTHANTLHTYVLRVETTQCDCYRSSPNTNCIQMVSKHTFVSTLTCSFHLGVSQQLDKFDLSCQLQSLEQFCNCVHQSVLLTWCVRIHPC